MRQIKAEDVVVGDKLSIDIGFGYPAFEFCEVLKIQEREFLTDKETGFIFLVREPSGVMFETFTFRKDDIVEVSDIF